MWVPLDDAFEHLKSTCDDNFSNMDVFHHLSRLFSFGIHLAPRHFYFHILTAWMWQPQGSQAKQRCGDPGSGECPRKKTNDYREQEDLWSYRKHILTGLLSIGGARLRQESRLKVGYFWGLMVEIVVPFWLYRVRKGSCKIFQMSNLAPWVLSSCSGMEKPQGLQSSLICWSHFWMEKKVHQVSSTLGASSHGRWYQLPRRFVILVKGGSTGRFVWSFKTRLNPIEPKSALSAGLAEGSLKHCSRNCCVESKLPVLTWTT